VTGVFGSRVSYSLIIIIFAILIVPKRKLFPVLLEDILHRASDSIFSQAISPQLALARLTPAGLVVARSLPIPFELVRTLHQSRRTKQ